MTSFNSFIRGSWQVLSDLRPTENYEDKVILSDAAVRMWRAFDVVFVHVSVLISFTPNAPSQIPYVDLVLPGPPAEFPVRVPIFLTNVKYGEKYFNSTMLEMTGTTLRVYNMPFDSATKYEMNAQFFYSP